MKLKTNTWYRTRSGDLAYVKNFIGSNYTWPWEGYICKKHIFEYLGQNLSKMWTDFGGASDYYNKNEKEVDLYYDPDDLIKELTKEDYPEVYL